MGLIDKINKTKFGLGGKTPAIFDERSSSLHNTTSVNNIPADKKGRKPSSLDLNAKTPEKYMDNLPK